MKTVLFFLITMGLFFPCYTVGQTKDFLVDQLFFQPLKVGEPQGKTNQELISKWYRIYETNEDSRKLLLGAWKRITENEGEDLEMIYKECQDNNVPFVEKTFVAIIESGWKDTTSYSGAVGHWQFMEKTAIDFGLKINEQVDERRDKIKSTKAALFYERDLFNTISKWALQYDLEVSYADKWHFAEASYNWGIGNMKQDFLDCKGDFDKFPDMVDNRQAREYVPRIFAARRWLRDYLISQGEIEPLTQSALGKDSKFKNEIKPHERKTIPGTSLSPAQFAWKTYLKFKDQMGPWERSIQLKAIRGMFLAEGHSEKYLKEILARIASERKTLN